MTRAGGAKSATLYAFIGWDEKLATLHRTQYLRSTRARRKERGRKQSTQMSERCRHRSGRQVLVLHRLDMTTETMTQISTNSANFRDPLPPSKRPHRTSESVPLTVEQPALLEELELGRRVIKDAARSTGSEPQTRRTRCCREIALVWRGSTPSSCRRSATAVCRCRPTGRAQTEALVPCATHHSRQMLPQLKAFGIKLPACASACFHRNACRAPADLKPAVPKPILRETLKVADRCHRNEQGT